MNHLLNPSHPNFPMQDKFGNVVAFTGLSKLEYAAISIFSNSAPGEYTANEAVNQAVLLLNAVNDKLVELSQQPRPSLHLAGK